MAASAPEWSFFRYLIFMQYTNVCIESLGYTLPSEIVTSDEIECRLQPAYERLELPEGRLELMTGIAARRFWEPGTLPGTKSIESGQQAIAASGIEREQIGMLIHGSVCRDHLEPATACRVHHELGLPSSCVIYDLSNACLGQLNGLAMAANAIELGQIQAALVVGTEDGGPLVENTIRSLNEDRQWTRQSIKMAVASLTIGSASSAMLITSADISSTGNRLKAITTQANTAHHELCHSGKDEAVAEQMSPLMHTDSEALMARGIETGVVTFGQFLKDAEWSRDQISKTVCHQVGSAHRRQMLESLDLRLEHDYSTFSWLGNTGSAALPVSWAIAAQTGQVAERDHLALLGIGSGINCVMLAVQWQRTQVASQSPLPEFLPATPA